MTGGIPLTVTARDDLKPETMKMYGTCVKFMAAFCNLHAPEMMADDILDEFKANVGKALIGEPKGSA